MAKILISSLGMGDRVKGYQKADYAIDDKIYRDRTFISSVLCEHIGIDKLFLVGTKDSIWESVYEEFGGDKETAEKIYVDKEIGTDIDFLLPVEQQIEKKLGAYGSKCFIIKYGLNEDELWLNFDKYLQIMSEISKDDEVYLDITHSFRSLSLMSFVMSEFYANTRDYNLNIKGVYYGMFEASEKRDDGTKTPAPIVDLKMFFELLEWSRAIKNLKFYGNGYELMTLIDKLGQPINIKNSYRNFSYALSMSDIGAIQKSVKSLSKEIFDFSDPKAHILKIIAKDIKEFIDIFRIDKLSDLQIGLASWYAKNKNFAMAYMTLAEAVPSLICEQNGKDPADRDAREDAKHTLGKCKKENYNSEHKKAAKIYFEINNIRVNIAHKLMDGDRRSNSDPQSSTDNIWEYIEKVKAMGKIHFKLQKRPPKK